MACPAFRTPLEPGEASGNVVAVGDDDGMVNLYRAAGMTTGRKPGVDLPSDRG